MKIDKVHIINYRSCANTTVVLEYNLTALIGVNRAGKSRFLGSLLAFCLCIAGVF